MTGFLSLQMAQGCLLMIRGVEDVQQYALAIVAI